MARSPLTLAALATSAVAGLDIIAARRHGPAAPAKYEQAVLGARDGSQLLIRMPRTREAQTRASAELSALRAVSTGIRGRLPFTVPSVLGEVAVSGTRAIVVDFLAGSPIALGDIQSGDIRAGGGLAAAIGRAIAAIHALPTSFVADAGLPVARPAEALTEVLTVVEKAVATGLVPAALAVRWEHATEDPALWQYAPTVINGQLTGDSVLRDDASVKAIVGWDSLCVGDPARDLAWVLGATASGAPDAVFDTYNQSRGSTDRQIKKRAMLYAELELAKWLVHGTELRSTQIVDDAVRLLHNLVDVVQHDPSRTLETDTRPVMTVDEVEDMLDRTERRP